MDIAIFITCDAHGDFTCFRKSIFYEQAELTKYDCVICLGGFGGIWDGDAEERRWLEAKPFTTLFVSGIHENFGMLVKFPTEDWHGGKVQRIRPSEIHLMQGKIYEIQGKAFFTMGGARSRGIQDGILELDDPLFKKKCRRLDARGAMYRVHHCSWWKEELPREEEYQTARASLDKVGCPGSQPTICTSHRGFKAAVWLERPGSAGWQARLWSPSDGPGRPEPGLLRSPGRPETSGNSPLHPPRRCPGVLPELRSPSGGPGLGLYGPVSVVADQGRLAYRWSGIPSVRRLGPGPGSDGACISPEGRRGTAAGASLPAGGILSSIGGGIGRNGILTGGVMREYSQMAPAKVNLALDVGALRPDGYHEMRMVMQAVGLQDRVSVRETEKGFRLTGIDLPEGKRSMEQQAAGAFFATAGQPMPGLEVHLEKRTPAYAGLGGGSADVAALLRLLRERYCPAMSPQTLEAIGLTVGSDVPFCLRGGAALAEGRGEVLKDLPPLPECWLVIAKPAFGLPTPEMFRRLDSAVPRQAPDVDGCAAALEAGDLAGAAANMGNVFESVLTPEERRPVDQIKEVLLRCGALNAAMSGSGPSVFGVFAAEPDAAQALEELSFSTQAFLTRPLRRRLLPDL